MNRSILPNLRWLTLPSEALGEDWLEKSQLIDEALEKAGMDLAEQVVFILFDRSPGAVLSQETKCEIGRPVIGPKRDFAAPFKLLDWTSAPVYKKFLSAQTWTESLELAYTEWESLQRDLKNPSRHFMLCLHRSLQPELRLQIEVIFTE